MRHHAVERWVLRRSENRGLLQNHHSGRNSQAERRRRKAVRLLRQDNPMVVVIRGRDLGDVIQAVAMMMRGQPRAQRHKDKEQSTRYKSLGERASHSVASPLRGRSSTTTRVCEIDDARVH